MPIDPQNFLSYPVWLSLPKETRYKIAKVFGIMARGVGHTVDNRVVADNFIHADLAVITRERMREMTDSESNDFYVLFQKLVDKVNETDQPKKLETQNVETKQTLPDVQPHEQKEAEPAGKGRRGRPRKGGEAQG